MTPSFALHIYVDLYCRDFKILMKFLFIVFSFKPLCNEYIITSSDLTFIPTDATTTPNNGANFSFEQQAICIIVLLLKIDCIISFIYCEEESATADEFLKSVKLP